MKKKDRNINWKYISRLTDVLIDELLGVLWMANMFIQLNAPDFDVTARIYAVASALLSVGWFVLAYHQQELLKTTPKNNQGERR